MGDSVISPAPIRHAGQREYAHEPVVSLPGNPSLLSVDVAALEKAYPEVSAYLRAAGLTAREYEAYRFALGTAIMADRLRSVFPNSEGSPSRQNIALMQMPSPTMREATAMPRPVASQRQSPYARFGAV